MFIKILISELVRLACIIYSELGYLALCLYKSIITHLYGSVYYIIHILVIHGVIFRNPFSERQASFLKSHALIMGLLGASSNQITNYKDEFFLTG